MGITTLAVRAAKPITLRPKPRMASVDGSGAAGSELIALHEQHSIALDERDNVDINERYI